MSDPVRDLAIFLEVASLMLKDFAQLKEDFERKRGRISWPDFILLLIAIKEEDRKREASWWADYF